MPAQVFIAHSTEDAEWLKRLRTLLMPLEQSAGLTCWDQSQIQPGQQREQEISAALAGASVAVLLVSPDFLASEGELVRELTARPAAAPHGQALKILWVAVKPCLWQDSALATYQPVHDVTRPLSALSDSEAEAALVEICQRIRAAVAMPAPAAGDNPYRGLSAFQLQDADLFFGREALTRSLWQQFETLYTNPDAVRLLTIFGPSGSGKSSVARAGLLAALKNSPVPGPQAMRMAILKPGERPTESLARALLSLLPPDPVALAAERVLSIEHLLRNPAAPAEGLRRFAAELPELPQRPVLVLVDQFEEVYTLCRDAAERDLFVQLLLHAAQARLGHVAVVLTLRSDFLGETQRYHNQLNRLIAQQGTLVPALSTEELLDAIANPAKRSGRPIDEATVQLVLTQAGGGLAALPLVEFALTQLWEGMKRGEEPGATLRRLGGVGGALAGEAQRIYDALSPAEQSTARRALVRLVQLGEGMRDTRRRAPLRELFGRGETEAGVLSVLRKFSTENARLVTLLWDEGAAVAEVAHEALFDHWAELRRWIDEGRADRRFHDRAAEATRLWNEAGQPAGRLWRSPDLDLLRGYQKRHPDELSPLQEAFRVASEQQQRREKLLSWGSFVALLTAVFVAAGIYVTKERQRARVERQRAIEVGESREQIRQQLLSTYVEQGRRLIVSEAKPLEALPWLHRAQKAGAKDPILPDLLREAMRTLDSASKVVLCHRNGVSGAVYSPDGKRVVTASADHTARVWDAETGRLVAELKGHGDRVSRAVYSPDGNRVVTASEDHTARVWDAETGRLVAELKGHGARVYSAVYSPDGKRVVTASHDNTARVWDAETGRVVAELKGHGRAVYSAVYNPDGKRVVTAGEDDTARVWDAETGRLVAELKGHGSSLSSAAYSPDGRRVVTASADDTARVWDAETGRLVTVLKGHGAWVWSAMYRPDGKRVVTASEDSTARVWDAETGRLVAELKGHGDRVRSAMYSPDGKRVVTASHDKTARVWDAETGRLEAELQGHGAWVASAMYSPDGKRVVTAGLDHTARVWEAETGRFMAELKGHGSSVIHAVYSPDGKRVVTASWDDTARVWEAETGGLVAELKGHGAIVWSAVYSPDGKRVVTASVDRTARVWEAETGRLVAELKGHGASVRSAVYSPDGKRVVTASGDPTARVWEAETGRLVSELKGHGASVWSAVYSPDGKRVVTASEDQTARVWEAETGRLVSELKGHGSSVLIVVYSPDGNRVLTASGDGTARVWDAETGRLVAELKGHGPPVRSAVYSPDGKRVVTASEDKTARVWEAETGRLVAELKGHGSIVWSAMYSPDGKRVVTASSDKTARVWEAETGRLVAVLKGHRSDVNSAMYSPDGKSVVTASRDQTARVWDTSQETRSLEQISKRIRCYSPLRFEPEDGNVLVWAIPDPTDCQATEDLHR